MKRIRLCTLLAAAGLLLIAGPVQAEQYRGNGNTGFDGAIGNGTLTLTDDGNNISGTLTVGGSMNDVLVLYIQTGPGGFTNTSAFNDQGDSSRQAISGASASGRSLLTFASGFQPNYAIALAPAAAGTGGLWQLANGGNNSLVYLGSVNLAPLNNTGPYTFTFPAALIGMIPGIRSTIQVFGTYVRADSYRSTEAIAGALTGVQGWNPFIQTAYASYTFDAGAVLVKLPLGVWAQRASGPPPQRSGHTAVWTGSEMIVWGGSNGIDPFNDGGRYNPAANTWTPLPTAGAPAARSDHTAVWTGSEMIIWGGVTSNGGDYYFSDGGRYNPTANSWKVVPTNGAPAGRYGHTAVWTGSEMVVWGGDDSTAFNGGGSYNPAVDSWTVLPATGAPSARHSHRAVWTGSEMIVWGGYSDSVGFFNDGGRYNPAANTWMALPTNGAPAARGNHTAVWTGSEMLVWGGINGGIGFLNDGGRYNPAANTWLTVQTDGAPAARDNHTAAWTGSEMIVWGGDGSSGIPFNDGGRYDPAANTWMALPTTSAPAGRSWHTAVWTGSEMIIWGGQGISGNLNDGGRYNLLANSWAPPPAANAPAARYEHTAVWTGSEMIVWGGSNGSYLGDGGRYNPAANSWTALPCLGAPAARTGQTAAWTGSEMIVWGGVGTNYFNDGGRYSPIANSWTSLPTNGAPAARSGYTAVWTGSEMIVWGGWTGNDTLNDGGRYNPAGNTWTAVPTDGAPAGRYGPTAVWTGNEMIIFGGGYGFSYDRNYLADTWSYYPYAPAVRISCSSPASADVAWPVWSSTLRLCQTTNLASGQWTTVTNAPAQVGAENHVTVSPLSGSQFFRAVYP